MSDVAIVLTALIALAAALSNLVVAVASLVLAIRAIYATKDVAKTMDGRLDQLLDERERRIRAEYAPAAPPGIPVAEPAPTSEPGARNVPH